VRHHTLTQSNKSIGVELVLKILVEGLSPLTGGDSITVTGKVEDGEFFAVAGALEHLGVT
jgi:hypothetical protein